MKRVVCILAGICSIALVIFFIAFGHAYYLDADRINNVLVPGGVHTRIVEEYTQEEVSPGACITKKVAIENAGPNDCYVRVFVMGSNSLIFEACQMDYDAEHWTYDQSEACWYYKGILRAGETTPYLFQNIQIADHILEDGMLSAEDLLDFDIYVYQESWQAAGYETCFDPWRGGDT